jgi:hypothetical protein
MNAKRDRRVGASSRGADLMPPAEVRRDGEPVFERRAPGSGGVKKNPWTSIRTRPPVLFQHRLVTRPTDMDNNNVARQRDDDSTMEEMESMSRVQWIISVMPIAYCIGIALLFRLPLLYHHAGEVLIPSRHRAFSIFLIHVYHSSHV